MSIIPEVKCRRCGTSFSAMRSRCPNCGTRRVAQSSRTPGTTPGTVKGTASYERAETNTKWQMIFGLILVVAVILAVIVMVTTSLNAEGQPSGPKVTPPPENIQEPGPALETPPPPPPTVTPTIQSINIMFGERQMNKDETTWPMMKVGEVLKYQAIAFPMDITGVDFNWSVEDETAFKLTPEDGGYCTIECLKHVPGGVKVTVEAFGFETFMRIYTTEG